MSRWRGATSTSKRQAAGGDLFLHAAELAASFSAHRLPQCPVNHQHVLVQCHFLAGFVWLLTSMKATLSEHRHLQQMCAECSHSLLGLHTLRDMDQHLRLRVVSCMSYGTPPSLRCSPDVHASIALIKWDRCTRGWRLIICSEAVREMLDAYAGCRYEYLDIDGHFMQWEDPEPVNKLLLSFLKEHEAELKQGKQQ